MFDISNDAADWIQDNLYLIDDGDLQQIVKKCPAKIVGEVLLAMDDVGAEIKEDPNSTEMWGIKSSGGRTTMSLGKHNKTNFNVNYTTSEGMKGGMQIGFKSVCDCIEFIKKLHGPENFRPSRMQPKTVAEYTWQEVDTIYGKCWVTNVAFDKYDPASAARNRKLKKADEEVKLAQIDWIKNNINIDKVVDAIVSEFGQPNFSIWDEPAATTAKAQGHYCGGCLGIDIANTSDEKRLTEIVSESSGYKARLLNTYVPNDPGLTHYKKIYRAWFQFDTPEFNAIKDDIYAKYGL